MRSNRSALALSLAGLGAVLAAKAWKASRAIDFEGKSVVIVGGSRGLGLIIARELGAEGARLTLMARDAAELERARLDLESRGSAVRAIACDIRDRAEVGRAIEEAAAAGGIDVLINDAGIIQVGPFDHMDVEDFENAMATHFWGPLYTILAALPHLGRSATPRIVNISSIGGKVPVPHLLPYCASKFALTGLSEGLRLELSRDGILVTTVLPGLMRTGSTYQAWFKGNHRREFAWFHTAGSMPGISIDATRAARKIISACRRGDAELIITPQARAAIMLNGVFPGTTAAVMALGSRLLPSPVDQKDGDEPRPGWQSVSRFAPSPLTRLNDRATVENNEVPVP